MGRLKICRDWFEGVKLLHGSSSTRWEEQSLVTSQGGCSFTNKLIKIHGILVPAGKTLILICLEALLLFSFRTGQIGRGCVRALASDIVTQLPCYLLS